MLVVDHKDRPIPIPMISSYSDGLDPVQYWAGAYGARKGEVSKKFATPKAGFLAKQLAMAAHRLVVTEKDCGTTSGISVNPNNPDNEGAVLAQGVGDYEAGDVMTPKMGRRLWRHKRIVVRSPITCQARQGVCQKCAGVREKGDFPPLGDNVGMAAAQAIAEPISQLQLSAKHSGGVASAGAPTVRGFDLINQLVQVPKTFQDAAAIATLDGRVGEIKEAPQGGTFIIIGGEDHWVPPDKKIQVERGQTVEAGDVLSEGIPNPSEIVRYKGIGEGRRYFTELFGKAMSENNLKAHRRNIELLSRGLINHVRITDPDGPEDTIIDDVVEFDSITRNYEPRVGAKTLSPRRSVGLYLERPVLHYSIGTRVSKRVADNLRKNKINEVLAHQDKPSFAPEMVRAMETLAHSSDWQVRLGGFHLQKGFLESVHRGRKTEEHGISFIPSLAKGTEFGRVPAGQGY
jgi:DNA-directed RNA polymerase subunit beta'